ncbi:MAG: hypothetical protein HOP21_06025 [Methylotenera sp.]|nr:hypothetical protein [Methylotenera sp.]
MFLIRIFSLFFLLFEISACSASTITGTIFYVPIDGECWTIKGDDKVTYEISNLPKKYQKNGMLVRAKIKILTDMSSICMAGTLAEIETIQAK